MAVYIAALPSTEPADLVETAKTAYDLGLEPVPHLVARNFASIPQLEWAVEQLSSRAGVRRALVLAGDRKTPAGPLSCAADILNTGILSHSTIPHVAFGCYPEGHPRICDKVLMSALYEKLALAERLGLNARLITQICFDPQTVLRFIGELREKGITAPIRYGVVGPTKLSTLVKYAAICGVGPSLRGLMDRPELRSKLLSRYTPESMISCIEHAAQVNPSLGIVGPHVFTFGSLRTAATWLSQSSVADVEAEKMASHGSLAH